jgi:hypothetical protein
MYSPRPIAAGCRRLPVDDHFFIRFQSVSGSRAFSGWVTGVGAAATLYFRTLL